MNNKNGGLILVLKIIPHFSVFCCFILPNTDSPVLTQMTVAILSSPLGNYKRCNIMEGKPTGMRRVFVQTETGCVLGMELNRSEHTMKGDCKLPSTFQLRRASLLTYGDRVLDKCLGAIQNDSPLLARNLIHRSSSQLRYQVILKSLSIQNNLSKKLSGG